MRLCQTFLGANYIPNESQKLTGKETAADIWILSKLSQTVQISEESVTEYDFGKYVNAIYMFWLYDFCDAYLEICKPTLFYKGDITEQITAAQEGHKATLYTVLDQALKTLHPVMPFITEELWQYLPRRPNDKTVSLCIADYPIAKEIHFDETSIAEFDYVQQVIKAIRNLSTACNIVKKGVTKATISVNEEKKGIVGKYQKDIITLAYLNTLTVVSQQEAPTGLASQQVDGAESIVWFDDVQAKNDGSK